MLSDCGALSLSNIRKKIINKIKLSLRSLATWPNRPSLRLRTMYETSNRPVRLRTSSLDTKSCQLMCRIRRWHRAWKECNLFQSACMGVQVSEPYSSMGNTHVEYMRSFVEILSLLWLQV